MRLGPKDARIEALKNPLCDSGYFRVGLAGHIRGFVELFSARAYVREVFAIRAPGSVAYRIQWA